MRSCRGTGTRRRTPAGGERRQRRPTRARASGSTGGQLVGHVDDRAPAFVDGYARFPRRHAQLAELVREVVQSRLEILPEVAARFSEEEKSGGGADGGANQRGQQDPRGICHVRPPEDQLSSTGSFRSVESGAPGS